MNQGGRKFQIVVIIVDNFACTNDLVFMCKVYSNDVTAYVYVISNC